MFKKALLFWSAAVSICLLDAVFHSSHVTDGTLPFMAQCFILGLMLARWKQKDDENKQILEIKRNRLLGIEVERLT